MAAVTPTKPGTARLSEVARRVVQPSGIVSTGWPAVQKTCSEKLGVEFDEWQKGAGRLMLAKRADGALAASIGGVGMSLPRQVGKTFLLAGVIFALCIDMPGLLVIWTAHHSRTFDETFMSMQAFSTRVKVAPHIQQVYTGSNTEEIRFHNGSRILFGARERGFGRGIPGVDILVMDEAQILSDRAMESMLATLNTSQFGLHLYVGTPPDHMAANSESFTRMRTEAISGESDDLVWIECGADDDADPDDRKQYAKANPSYPHRTPLTSIQRLRKKLTPEGFLREGLGVWPAVGGGLISPETWSALVDPQSEPLDPVSFGLHVNRGQTQAAIAVAGYRADGKIHVGVIPAATDQPVTSLPGTAWIAPRVKELVEKWKPCATVIDEKSEAGALIEDIAALGVEVEKTTATTMANACVRFLAAVNEDEIRHHGNAALQASVTAGKPRDLLDSWAWDRKDKRSDITQLVAVTLALHGLIAHGRQPAVEVWEPLWT